MAEQASLQHISVTDRMTDKPDANYVILDETYQEPPSRLAIKNEHVRECLAEFLGTFILIAFGVGVNNEVSLNNQKNGTWLSINIAWGLGVMFGVHASDGVSGAHLNPAVTLTMAWFGKLPWWKVPGYVFAQVFGAFCAAICIYVMYKPLYDVVDPDRVIAQGNFATYPAQHIPNATAFFTEAFATAILLAVIFSLGDKNNRPAAPHAAPVHLMLVIWGLGMSFGSNSGYALNPARDFGPRLATSICGWGSKVYTLRDYYFWIPIVAPCVGGIVGGYVYKLFVEIHHPRRAPTHVL